MQAAQAADARYFRHILSHAQIMAHNGKQWLIDKANLLHGTQPRAGSSGTKVPAKEFPSYGDV